MTKVGIAEEARIQALHDAGWKQTDIARDLDVNQSTVSRTLKKLKEGDADDDSTPKRGRPPVMDERDVRCAVRAICSGFAADATDLKRKMFPHVSVSIVRQRLYKAGLKGRIRRKKPLLRKNHRKARRKWARAHRLWLMRKWRRVVYSDESKFNLFGSDGRLWCRRREGEEFEDRNVRPVVKHGGGSVMVWGCITWDGPGRLQRVEGKMNAEQYCSILESSFLGTLQDKKMSCARTIFQQDNDPKHTSRKAAAWFKTNHITVMPWPASSPDANIIEHVWHRLEIKVHSRPVKPSNLEELWVALQEEWARLDLGYIRRLYCSIPRRLEAMWRARGGHTSY